MIMDNGISWTIFSNFIVKPFRWRACSKERSKKERRRVRKQKQTIKERI